MIKAIKELFKVLLLIFILLTATSFSQQKNDPALTAHREIATFQKFLGGPCSSKSLQLVRAFRNEEAVKNIAAFFCVTHLPTLVPLRILMPAMTLGSALTTAFLIAFVNFRYLRNRRVHFFQDLTRHKFISGILVKLLLITIAGLSLCGDLICSHYICILEMLLVYALGARTALYGSYGTL